MLRLSVERLEM